MDFQRALDTRAEALTNALVREAGFTASEARRFLWEAAPALAKAYEWSSAALAERDPTATASLRDILASVRGRRLARRAGLPPTKAWEGLRVITPRFLEAARTAASPGPGVEGAGQDETREGPVRFEIGFGMAVYGRPRRREKGDAGEPEAGSAGIAHPIFDLLLR